MVNSEVFMAEQDSKKWYLSKGVVGGFVSLLAFVALLFGYTVTESDQVVLTELVVAISGAVASVVGIIGRIKADTKIG
jgi:NADPH-dependent curcumin reductase CurA